MTVRTPAPRGGHRDDAARWPLAVAVLLAVAGLLVNLLRPTAPGLPAGVPDLARFDEAVRTTIASYRAPRVALAPLVAAVAVAVPWALAAWPAARRWLVGGGAWDRPGDVSPGRGGRAAVGMLAVTSLATLPFAAWIGLVHERRWGFRTSTAGRWWADWALTSAGRWLAVGVGVAVLLLAARRWPRTWPSRVTVGASVAGLAVVGLHPVLLQPLLLDTEPLGAGSLRDELTVLAEDAGVVVPLVVADASRRTTRFNALVVGLGPTERIVLFDTLLDLPDDQVVALVAHELAHQRHRDLLRGTALVPTAVLPLALGWQALLRRHRARRWTAGGGPADARTVLLLVAVGLTVEVLAGPLAGAQSRRVEAAADHHAFQLGADPATAIALTRTAVVRDLADPTPTPWLQWWYGTHPTPTERIRAAVAAAARDGAALPDRAELDAMERDVRHPRLPDSAPDSAPGGAHGRPVDGHADPGATVGTGRDEDGS